MAAWWKTSLTTHTTGKGLPPSGDWFAALWQCGRGFGKTRIGAEHILGLARYPALCGGRLAIVGKTNSDTRDTMILGESGILACADFYREHVSYKPSRRLLTWRNGVIASTYSDEAPGRLRGPQHGGGWADEIGEYEHTETLDNLAFGLRLGLWPHYVGTLTPKSSPIVLALHKDPDVVWTRGSMYENQRNLPARTVAKLERRFKDTRIGRQELMGELLVDHGGALWTLKIVDDNRVRNRDAVPPLMRVVVAVDPSGSDPMGKREADDDDEGAETGIIAAGIDFRDPPHVYVLSDYTCPPEAGPLEWGGRADTAYRIEKADRVVGEVNYGGRLVETNLRGINKSIPFRAVWAKEGKRLRAEPVAALYEQGRVHHVGGLQALEDQMTTWVPGHKSPDRLDALVHAITDLALTDDDDDEPGDLSAYLGRNTR